MGKIGLWVVFYKYKYQSKYTNRGIHKYKNTQIHMNNIKTICLKLEMNFALLFAVESQDEYWGILNIFYQVGGT